MEYGRYIGSDNKGYMIKVLIAILIISWLLVTALVGGSFFMLDKVEAQDTTKGRSKMDKAKIDILLKGKWEGMKQALANKDIEKALSYFSVLSREHYREMFTALRDHLPQIAQDLQDIKLVEVGYNEAKYRCRKNELYGGQIVTVDYPVYFVVDIDGEWKIQRY